MAFGSCRTVRRIESCEREFRQYAPCSAHTTLKARFKRMRAIERYSAKMSIHMAPSLPVGSAGQPAFPKSPGDQETHAVDTPYHLPANPALKEVGASAFGRGHSCHR